MDYAAEQQNEVEALESIYFGEMEGNDPPIFFFLSL